MLSSIFLAAAIAAQPAPQASTEMLGIDVPDEFQVGNHQRNDTAEIIELVEPPETIDNWSKLVTSLMFFNAAQVGLKVYFSRWRDGLREGCPGMQDTETQWSVDGHPAIRAALSCPNNPQTGKPENLTAVLVRGDANVMMAQVAFRHVVSPPDTALIEHVANSLKVCDQRTLEGCSARKATGFIAKP